MPMIGIGEPVARVVECLEQGPSVLVLDGGHPIGVLTRSDVLAFLADARAADEQRPTATTASRRARSTRARSPTRRPARSSRRSASSTTFAQDAVGKHRGYEYARSGNPTRTRSRRASRRSRARAHGLAFASGLAAEDAILRTLDPGDHVIIPTTRTAARSGSSRACTSATASRGPPPTSRDLDALEAAWRDETRMVWIETPTNPALSIVDIAARRASSRTRASARVVVDNTFATPYLQQPLALGADVVGALEHEVPRRSLRRRRRLRRASTTPSSPTRSRFLQNAMGAVPSPFDCYLVLRGVKTLAVRMERHCANARRDRRRCSREHPAVARVLYPGLPEHPGHDVARRQMRDFGGMVSFLAAGGEDAALDARRAHPPVHAGRVARRGRVAHRASRRA